MIACLHLSPFAATVARRAERGDSAPLLLVTPERVYATCEQGTRSGVRPGMSLPTAQSLCPRARQRTARPSRDRQARAEVERVLHGFAPGVEIVGDVQGLNFLLALPSLGWTEATELVREIGRAVREETALPPAVGLAGGRFPAQVAASSVSPHRARVLRPDQAAPFLATHPLETLPIASALAERLHFLGIHTIGDFAALPPAMVFRLWGKEGRSLHRLAQGQDPRPLQPRPPAPRVEVTFLCPDPLHHPATIRTLLQQQARRLGWELLRRRMRASALWLRVELEDGTTRERRRTLAEPVGELHELLPMMAGLLEQVRLSAPLLSLTLRATALLPAHHDAHQLALWEEQPGAGAAFQELLPFLRERYGTDRFLALAPDDEAGFHARPVAR